MSFFDDFFGSKNTYNTGGTTTYSQLPDYSESNQARGTWGNTLQSWAGQPGYGAIQPDWNSIWQNAAGKVNRYFNGGPEGPGLIAGVKSNLAARGMSENPAAETQISNLGMQEGLQLQDIGTQEATQQAALEEQGRQTWLNSIMQLSGLKPQFAATSTTGTSSLQQTPSPMTALSPVGTMLGNGSIPGAMSSIMSMFGGGGGGGSTSLGSADPSNTAGVGGAGTDLSSLLPMLMQFLPAVA